MSESKGDLHDKSFLASIGEEFGSGVGRTYGLRNADKDVKISDVTDEIHDLSRVFTGAVYDVLVEGFLMSQDIERQDPAETLYLISNHLCAVTIVAFIKAPKDPTFADVANLMIKLESNKKLKNVMKNIFTKRQVFDNTVKPKSTTKSKFYLTCGTLQRKGDNKVNEQFNRAMHFKKLL